MFNLKEGLARRIISVLNAGGGSIPPITKDVLNTNHQRYGHMIDRIHDENKEFREKLNKKPTGNKPMGFKQFRKN